MSSGPGAAAVLGALLCSVACGGGDGGRAGGQADGGDGAIDGGSGGGSGDDAGSIPAGPGTIWVHGDLATDGVAQLLVYRPGDPLPAAPAMVMPQAGEAGAPGAFDVSPDGARVAFAADLAVSGRFDLYVASADGTGALPLVTMSVSADVTAVRFSPDGARVAYAADAEVDEQSDAYAVALDGGDPVRVTPPRPGDPALDVDDLLWSRDGQRLAVTGSFTDAGAHELWITDLTAPVPEPVALVDRARIEATADIGPLGVVTPVLDDGDRVLFVARLDADERYKLHRIDPSGTGESIVPGSEIARANDTIADIGPIAASPDGTSIAFAADRRSGIYDLFLLPAAGGTPLQLTDGATLDGTNPSFVRPLWWSPDGTRIAFVGDYAVPGRDDPYVVPLTGGELHLAAIGASTAQDADQLAWSADSSTLVMLADHRADNTAEVFALDPTLADQSPALVFSAPDGGDADALRTAL